MDMTCAGEGKQNSKGKGDTSVKEGEEEEEEEEENVNQERTHGQKCEESHAAVTERLAVLQQELEALGGREAYQQASIVGNYGLILHGVCA